MVNQWQQFLSLGWCQFFSHTGLFWSKLSASDRLSCNGGINITWVPSLWNWQPAVYSLMTELLVSHQCLFSFSSNLMATGRLSHDEGVDEANNATQVLLLQEFQVCILHTLHNECCALAYTYTARICPNKFCMQHLNTARIFFSSAWHAISKRLYYLCIWWGEGFFLGQFYIVL